MREGGKGYAILYLCKDWIAFEFLLLKYFGQIKKHIFEFSIVYSDRLNYKCNLCHK